MFGWFGEFGGTRKSHTSRCLWSLNYLAERKARKTTKIIFRVFNTCKSSPILLFCPRKPKSYFFENTKRRAPENRSKSVRSKVDLEPYGAIWCQFGCQFRSQKVRILVRGCVFSYRLDSSEPRKNWVFMRTYLFSPI